MTNSHFKFNYHLCNKALIKLISNLLMDIYSTLTLGYRDRVAFIIFGDTRNL